MSNVFSPAGRRKLAAKKHSRTKETYLTQVEELSGTVTRFDVVFQHDPFSPAAETLLNRIDRTLAALSQDEQSSWHGTEFDLVGTTAGKRDLQAVTNSDQWRIQQLVTLAVLTVLVVILRRPLVCVYLILSVLFSYLVTIGLTDMMFAGIYGATFEGLDWKVPIFLFVILVAIGEDYNIYLVTRVIEEQAVHGPIEGLRRAVTYTGGIITSCGLIMAGSFMSMMTGTLRGMLELGFALSLGILLDTFVIRTVIVPSFLAILARREERRLQAASTVAELKSGGPLYGSHEARDARFARAPPPSAVRRVARTTVRPVAGSRGEETQVFQATNGPPRTRIPMRRVVTRRGLVR